MVLKYVTTLQFAESLGFVREVPSWDISSTPTDEAVDTGDNSKTIFYLDQKNVIANTYTLYANASAMTETTHYTLELSTGKITLTSQGVTLLSTNNLTAKYKYFGNGMSDSYLNDILNRVETEIDNKINSTFTDGSVTNPSYPLITEYQPSFGPHLDNINLEKKPLKDISSTLNGAHNSSITTISLESGTGNNYPTSGNIIIGSEVINYTGISTDDLTGCTRGYLGTTAVAHSNGDEVHSTILFRSNTDEGTSVSWVVQPWNTSMYANSDGLIYRYDDADPTPLSKQGVANRIKIIYYYGYDTIPKDITRLAILLTKEILISDTIGKALISGRDEFKPAMINVDKQEVNNIIDNYIIMSMGNT